MSKPDTGIFVRPEAEEAVLGAMLQGGESVIEVAVEKLTPADFFYEKHGDIYAACQAVYIAGHQVDIAAVFNELKRTGRVTNDQDTLATLSGMVAVTSSTLNVKHHVDIVLQASARNRIDAIARKLQRENAQEKATPDELWAATETTMTEISERLQPSQTEWIGDLAEEIVAQVIAGGDGTTSEDFIETGLESVDELIGGFENGTYILLGGTPSVGKSALTQQISEEIEDETTGVLYFVAESIPSKLVGRALARRANINARKLTEARLGKVMVSEGEAKRLTEAATEMKSQNVAYQKARGWNVSQIRANVQKVRRQMAARGVRLKLIVIDYIGELDGPGENQTAKIEAISSALGAICQSTNTTMICITSLNGEGFRGRSNLMHLRDSRKLAFDADVVILLYREAEKDIEKWNNGGDKTVEFIIEKARDGQTGIVPLHFERGFQQFTDDPEYMLKNAKQVPGLPPPRSAREQANDEFEEFVKTANANGQ